MNEYDGLYEPKTNDVGDDVDGLLGQLQERLERERADVRWDGVREAVIDLRAMVREVRRG